MKYIISEEELKEFKVKPIWTYGFAERGEKDAVGRVVKDFLKSKQPVEMITRGKVIECIDLDNGKVDYSLDTPSIRKLLFEKIKQYKGDNIKIYIQKVSK